MNDFTPLTDEDIEAERKAGKHKRSEQLDTAFTSVSIRLIQLGGILLGIALIYGVGLYLFYLTAPTLVNADSAHAVEAIITHAIAGSTGYIAHLAKRNLDIKD